MLKARNVYADCKEPKAVYEKLENKILYIGTVMPYCAINEKLFFRSSPSFGHSALNKDT